MSTDEPDLIIPAIHLPQLRKLVAAATAYLDLDNDDLPLAEIGRARQERIAAATELAGAMQWLLERHDTQSGTTPVSPEAVTNEGETPMD